MKTINLTVEFNSEAEIVALAQFLKRVSFVTCNKHSDPTISEEPYLMLHGLWSVQRALAHKGYSPR